MNERFVTNREADPTFPAELESDDLDLVRQQCEIQQATSPEQLAGFAAAYLKAKQLTEGQAFWQQLDQTTSEQLILELAVLIEKANAAGFRRAPATFMDGSRALDASKIEQAIKSFIQGFISFLEDPTEDERLNAIMLYTEFEKIHPFVDGNGRVGDLLWKILETRKRGEWPLELPPNVFGEKRGDATTAGQAAEQASEREISPAELRAYLDQEELDLPILRRNPDVPGNLKWLNQNLGIRNDVPDAVIRAIRRELHRQEREAKLIASGHVSKSREELDILHAALESKDLDQEMIPILERFFSLPILPLQSCYGHVARLNDPHLSFVEDDVNDEQSAAFQKMFRSRAGELSGRINQRVGEECVLVDLEKNDFGGGPLQYTLWFRITDKESYKKLGPEILDLIWAEFSKYLDEIRQECLEL